MSDNIYNGKNLHVNAYIKASGRVLQPPMLLSQESGEMPKDLSEVEMVYHISNNDGASVELVGWEAALAPLAILMDALHRESVLKGIRKPSREQLEELRTAVDKIGSLIPHESEQR